MPLTNNPHLAFAKINRLNWRPISRIIATVYAKSVKQFWHH
jgi:hypothetical protein